MYRITEDNKFLIENYNWETSFSNFFPGIAGHMGIPMWIYYVSRGQGICSMGVKDKNNPLMEFLSFNKALDAVSRQGFRTFIKTGGKIYEPFKKTEDKSIKQTMLISSAELQLIEENKKLGLRFELTYFPIADSFYPALARVLKIRNLGPARQIEVIDGLPKLYPKGVDLHCVQTIARHIEGMMNVEFIKGVPVYRLKQSPEDTEQVTRIDGGNFYLSFIPGKSNIARDCYVVDPFTIFGESEIYEYPWNFKKNSVSSILREKQIKQNKTPCAFTALKIKLTKNAQSSVASLIGSASTDKRFLRILKEITKKGYIEKKRSENTEVIETIKNYAFCLSGDRKFDEYSKQSFLDNVIRGGMPVMFDTASGKSAFYVYSRQNGDLERDYHNFVVDPTYFSQGTGHYRSVNQNRRCDSWFFPETRDANIRIFGNLIQTDGYNPLEVTQMTYTIKKTKQFGSWLRTLTKKSKLIDELTAMAERPFSPGEFLMKLEDGGVKVRKNYKKTLSALLSFAAETECGAIHEGYWVDHWLYNLDLIDNFLMVYPDKLEEFLIREKSYYFYDNPDIILPNSEKYVLSSGKVRRYGAVVRNAEKQKLIKSRSSNAARMRTKYGKGKIYYTHFLSKMLCMTVNRLASFDPFGAGIEMEADKPGWNDSMNGLPGIVGSSLCQTIELEKALLFLRDAIPELKTKSVHIHEELSNFMNTLEKAADKKLKSKSALRDMAYWKESAAIKEKYRKQTIFGISGKEKEMAISALQKFVDKGLQLTQEALKKRIFKKGVPYTYFENRVVSYKKTGRLASSGHPLVTPLKFKQIALPLFLEGPVHMLKVHKELRKRIYSAVKKSGIYDSKLKMYKVCESLDKAPFEIGRVKAWGAGWIENESVYTHMLYKYLLELLRSGLHDEFFKDMDTMFMNNLDPKKYGRSVLENVSFIVSSAFPDEKMHGRGLQPRLSGVTGEMITMWIFMTAGLNPFFIDGKGKLNFKLSPILRSSFFTKEEEKSIAANSFAFRFLGKVLVIYRNPKRKKTYGVSGVKPVSYTLHYKDKSRKTISAGALKAPYALDIRENRVEKIIAELA